MKNRIKNVQYVHHILFKIIMKSKKTTKLCKKILFVIVYKKVLKKLVVCRQKINESSRSLRWLIWMIIGIIKWPSLGNIKQNTMEQNSSYGSILFNISSANGISMRCETPGLFAMIAVRTSSQFSLVSLSALVQCLFNKNNMSETTVKKLKRKNFNYSKFGSFSSQSNKNQYIFLDLSYLVLDS